MHVCNCFCVFPLLFLSCRTMGQKGLMAPCWDKGWAGDQGWLQHLWNPERGKRRESKIPFVKPHSKLHRQKSNISKHRGMLCIFFFSLLKFTSKKNTQISVQLSWFLPLQDRGGRGLPSLKDCHIKDVSPLEILFSNSIDYPVIDFTACLRCLCEVSVEFELLESRSNSLQRMPNDSKTVATDNASPHQPNKLQLQIQIKVSGFFF